MKDVVFWGVVANLLFTNAQLVFSIVRPELRLWPPPDPGTRRHRFTQVNAVVTPLMGIGILALGFLDRGSLGLEHATLRMAGGTLFVSGCGFAFWGYTGLGVRASQGQHEGLVAKGAYRYSRNPQYVGTIVGLLGYALVWGSAQTLVVWLLWSAWFVMAPLAEEPWLRERLGDAFDTYAAQVPRFIGRPPSSRR